MAIETKQIPDSLIISDVTINNYHRVYSTESISGIQNRRDTGIQRFNGSITLTAEGGFIGAKALNLFIMSLRGKYNLFEIELGGAYATPEIISSGANPSVNGSHGTGDSTINMKNNVVGAVPIVAGSVFNVDGETKLYTIMDDLPVIESQITNIIPAFKSAHNNVPMNFLNPTFTAILDDNNTAIEHTEGGLIASVTINWTEDLTV